MTEAAAIGGRESFNEDSHRPRIGISRCLLGDDVRFDGGHKRDPFLKETLGRFVEWVAVCPEVEVGMGIPREAIQLVAAASGVPAGAARVRLLGVRSRTDWTDPMVRYSSRRARELVEMDLSGYVLKKDSPSCGLERVRVYSDGGRARSGRGLLAQALLTAMPNLPVEEEGRIHDPRLRENFIERVFAYRRVRALFSGRWTAGALVRFHTVHKLQLLAHSRVGYQELGRLVAEGDAGRSLLDPAKSARRGELAGQYERLFMEALARMATPGRHADVMMHMLGHLKRLIDTADRDELLTSVEAYRRGELPLIVPITLFRHHVRRHAVDYLSQQTYLDPHPRELALRNHV